MDRLIKLNWSKATSIAKRHLRKKFYASYFRNVKAFKRGVGGWIVEGYYESNIVFIPSMRASKCYFIVYVNDGKVTYCSVH